MIKRIAYSLLPAFLFTSCSTVFARDSVAEEPFLNVMMEKLHELENPPSFGVQAHILQMGGAKISEDNVNDQYVHYREANAQITYTFLPTCTESYTVGLAYSSLYLDWEQNPFFHQKNFTALRLALLATTSRFHRWFWQAAIADRTDPAQSCSSLYSRYYTQIWGRWEATDNIGLHIGGIAQAGIEKVNVYPILGIDYAFGCNWKLNLVWPTNISLLYRLNSNWAFSVAARFFKTRYRSEKTEPLSRSIFQYQNAGAEAAVTWRWLSLSLRAFIGSSFEGSLEFYNQKGFKVDYMKLDPAFYGGATFSVHF